MRTLVCLAFATFVSIQFGYQFGYAYFSHNPNEAGTYGYPILWIIALCFAFVVVWPIVRGIGNMIFSSAANTGLAATRWFHRSAPVPAEQIEGAIERGTVAKYFGLVDRDIRFVNNSGQNDRSRVRVNFELRRNTRAMPPREREAYRILSVLEAHKCLRPKEADQLRFSLVYGDGRCEVYGGSFKADDRMFQQSGIRSFRDLIAYEAGQRSASVEAAFSELLTTLQAVAQHSNAPAEVRKLYETYLPPDSD